MNARFRSRLTTLSLAAMALPIAAVALTLAAASCDDGTHTYAARLFDRTRSCLGPAQSLDVVTGSDPGAGCAVKCLVAQSQSGAPSGSSDGGPAPIYVSTQCPPYPPLYDTSGFQPGCDEAIAALERGDICIADGGSSHPYPDSGSGAQDASSDAGDSGDGATLQDASLDADASDT